MVSVKIFWCWLRRFWSLLNWTWRTEQRLKDEVDCGAVNGIWYVLSETAGVNTWSYVLSRKERANGWSNDLWTFKSKYGLEDVWAVSWKHVLDAACENLGVGWGWKVDGIVEHLLCKPTGLLLPNDWMLLYFTDTFSGV